MHGGVKVYRGAASAARAYVEAGSSRVDDYYLAEGSGLASRFSAAPGAAVDDLGVLDGDGYEVWVAGHDPVSGEARGQLRRDDNAVRFVEITVNGPKTWSLAAALSPEVAAAYDAAQNRAAEQIIAWVAEHTTTRVGPRGRQVQVPVERIEAVTVRHFTSRAGDPHRHLHLQFNARVFADGRWRGLHTVGFRDSIEALNGVGHAAVMTDPELRAAVAAAGLTLDPSTCEVAELAPYVGGFSERAAQIGRNIDRYEAEWRAANPGQEPGPTVRQSWDRRAWKDARPDKIVPTDGAAMRAHWNQQLYDLGYRGPVPQPGQPIVGGPRVGALDREAAVETVVTRLGARRSAWNPADIRGEVEKWIAATGLVADASVRSELAEDLTARVIEMCVPLLDCSGAPEHVRSLTSTHVVDVEADIVSRLASRAKTSADTAAVSPLGRLDEAQRSAVAILTGQAKLVVVEGAAGAGKTTTLAAVKTAVQACGHQMLVVTPTLRAAQVAAREVGQAGSVSWLVHQHGFRWDDDGRWTRHAAMPCAEALLAPGDLLLVDEAGMLDQDTAAALLTVADEMHARVAFLGDRHQLPAVGRGGVLDLAARWVTPQAHVDLDVVHRFNDPEYAAISLALRTGSATYFISGEVSDEGNGERVGEVWGALWRRDQVCIYPSQAERTQTLARLATDVILTRRPGTAGALMMADTREQAVALNGAIRDRLVAAGHVDDNHATVTAAGERIGVGDRVATRRNDRTLGVTNRDSWTVTGIGTDGSLTVRGRRPTDVHAVPGGYVHEHVELAYATTVYGAQGETTNTGHLVLGQHTTAASAYVGMTRGRHDNVIHIVANDDEDARRQWDVVFSRDRADLGPTAAAQRAGEDVERYGAQRPARPFDEVLVDLRAAWTEQADLTEHHQSLVGERDALQQVAAIRDRYAPVHERLRAEQSSAGSMWPDARGRVADLAATMESETAELQTRIGAAWRRDLSRAQRAADSFDQGPGRWGQRRRQVQAASSELAAFAERWRPVHPDLATGPVGLAQQVPRLHGREVEEQIDAYVTRRVTEAHPDADDARQAERTAWSAFEAAERARTRLDNTLSEKLRPYRRAAHVADPVERLTAVIEEMAVAERNLKIAKTRVGHLQNEPVIRALGAGGLDTEHSQWAADRAVQHETAAREPQARRWRQQEAHGIGPNHAGHTSLDHAPSIGR